MGTLKIVRTVIEKVVRFSGTVGMIFVLPLMFLTTADVVGRGFFNKPIAGTFELSEYMLAVIILLGAAYTQQVKGHVAVDFITSRFATKTRLMCQIEKKSANDFPIVGIGGSAGGLEAFAAFFSVMPADSGIAFVVIPHLDPGHKSMMTDLLGRHTRMKVEEAEDGVMVTPNHVYIIPPNKDMAIYHGALHLTTFLEPRGLRMPIDFFCRSIWLALPGLWPMSGSMKTIAAKDTRCNGRCSACGMTMFLTMPSFSSMPIPRSHPTCSR